MSNVHSHRVSVAGIRVSFDSRLEHLPFQLAETYSAFETAQPDADVEVLVRPLGSAVESPGPFLFRCSNWSVRREAGRTFIETYHPMYSRVLATAEAGLGFRRYELRYNESFLKWLHRRNGVSGGEAVVFSYPLEQLMLLPVLARSDGFLVHACGAVIDGEAFVFAGHSGDGKTTLSRLLAGEGVELLSDERIAIRKVNGSLMAYGTPWPGEGHVVSASSYPLGGVFLLRKADRHRLREARSAEMAAELLSRSIVPYYFAEETERILALIPEITAGVRLGELDFSLSPGILPVLARVAR